MWPLLILEKSKENTKNDDDSDGDYDGDIHDDGDVDDGDDYDNGRCSKKYLIRDVYEIRKSQLKGREATKRETKGSWAKLKDTTGLKIVSLVTTRRKG